MTDTPVVGDPPRAETRGTRLPILVQGAYGAGGVGEALMSTAVRQFLPFLYITVLGLPGWLAGLAYAASLVFDAVTDMAMGYISDTTRSRHGRRHPWMLLGAPILALAFYLCFAPPLGLGVWALFAWLLGVNILMRFGLTLFQVPYLALGAELSERYQERAAIAAWRAAFGIVGAILAIRVAYGLFEAASTSTRAGQFAPEAYREFALWGALAILVAGAVAMLGTYRSRWRLHAPAERGGLGAAIKDFLATLATPSFRVLFASGILFYAAEGLHTTLGLHVNTYFWRLETASIELTALAYLGGLLIGVPLSPLSSRIVEKHVTVIVGLVLLLLAQSVVPTLGVFGLVRPEPEAPLVTLLSINAAIAGIGVTMATIAVYAMMADAVDEHEHLTARRHEGLFFGGLAFSAKMSWAVGVLIGGVAIDLAGLPRPEPGGALSDAAIAPEAVSPEVARTLAVVYGPLASAIAFAGMLTLLGYKLTRARHAAIREELDTRRALKAGTPGEP